MHFRFKQSVCLNGVDYRLGVHELSAEFFEKLSKSETFNQNLRLELIEEVKYPVRPKSTKTF